MKSKPDNVSLSVCVQGEKGDASKRGVQRASSDRKTSSFFLGSVPSPGEGVCGPTVCYERFFSLSLSPTPHETQLRNLPPKRPFGPQFLKPI